MSQQRLPKPRSAGAPRALLYPVPMGRGRRRDGRFSARTAGLFLALCGAAGWFMVVGLLAAAFRAL